MDIIYNMKRELLRRKMSRKTVKTYLFYVNKFLLANKDKPVKKFSKKDVREFLYKMEESDVSGSTLNVAHNALRFMMVEVLHKSCYLKIKYSKVTLKKPEYLTKEEILRILGVIDNYKHRILVSLMYGAGLRVNEVVNLKVSDFVFDEGIGWVKNGKGSKDRAFIIPDKIKEDLKSLCIEGNYWLFPGRNGCLSVRSVQNIVERAGMKAGIKKKVHPHMFRHSFTTHLFEEGVDIASVQNLLGHSRPETTLGYSHFSRPEMFNIKSPLDNQNV